MSDAGAQAAGEPSRVSVALEGGGRCTVRHLPSGVRVRTSRPPEYGGAGGSFSSTDLLAAALGSCIATDVEILAERHGVDIAAVDIKVEKTLSLRPKRVDAFRVVVLLPADVQEDLLPRFERAAGHCLVRRSLATAVRVVVDVRRAAQ